MSERFIKFIPSDEAMYLLIHKGNAFRLLTIIAESARRYSGGADGLQIGEAFLGDWKSYGMTEQNYRTAKRILIQRQHLLLIETNRNRKKSTTGVTTAGTKVKLISSNVYDINIEMPNDRPNDCLTTDQRLPNDELRKKKKDKNEKESHPSIPSLPADRMIDDFSSKIEVYKGIFLTQVELDACLKIKGSLENVRDAIAFIQNSKRRKHDITDWPNALSRWKIENKAQTCVQDNISYADKLCKEFEDFKKGNGWRCYMYTDRKKDQRGILFESESAYQQAFFIPLIDQELKNKAEEFIKTKKMRRK